MKNPKNILNFLDGTIAVDEIIETLKAMTTSCVLPEIQELPDYKMS